MWTFLFIKEVEPTNNAAELARAFQGRRSAQRVERIEEILVTLHALGHIQPDPAGGYRVD